MYYVYPGMFLEDFKGLKAIAEWQGIQFFTLNPNYGPHKEFINKYYKGNNLIVLKTHKNEFLDLADESRMTVFYGVWPFVDHIRNGMMRC